MNYMGKVAGLVFILFFLKPGSCEWKQVSQSEKGTYYIDPGSVLLIDEGIKSVWVLINFKQENKKIKSRQLKLEMDCLSSEMRGNQCTLTVVFLGGIPVKEYYKAEEWRSIDTDADLGIVYKRFCKK